MDPYIEALLGDFGPPQKQQALADALARRKAVARFGLMSQTPLGSALYSSQNDQEQLDAKTQAQGQAVKRFLLEKALAGQRQQETDARAERFHSDQMSNNLEAADRANRSYGLQATQTGLAVQAAKRATDAAEALKNERASTNVEQLATKLGDSPSLVAEKLARIKKTLASTSDLPGFGKAASFVPDMVASDEAVALRADARELVNTLLMLQSGTGVSNTERENKYRSYGLTAGASEEAFRAGMKRIEADLAKAVKSKEAGFSPETVQTYKARGGTTSEALTAPAAGAKVRVRNLATGQTGLLSPQFFDPAKYEKL